ncbi:MAG TPA: ABC transporter permease, partial [Tepidisphaeraceae bacterium]|nr:ABC transporter permease [Tepidisphaeraceae bacterium]
GCGLTFVIVTGEIDISVGSLMGLLAAILGMMSSPSNGNISVPIAIAATIAVGTLVGLINGLLVTFGRVPSIIVTLGMLTALRGATQMIMGGKWIVDLPPSLAFIGKGAIIGIPVSLWVAVIVVVLAMILARNTPLGRRIYAVGSNPSAAPLAGLSSRRIKIFVFTLTGFLTAIATIVSVPQLSTIESGVGVGLELVVVTGVVVGGTAISGGKGSILGTLLGVILLSIVRTALIYLKVDPYWERAIQGAFILVAVLVDHLVPRAGSSRGHG